MVTWNRLLLKKKKHVKVNNEEGSNVRMLSEEF